MVPDNRASEFGAEHDAAAPVGDACTWCGGADADLTADHVFPECVGGARPLVVPACGECQSRISTFEREVSRSSPLAIGRLMHGPAPRKQRDPRSGRLESEMVTVRDPRGGWCEVAVRAARPVNDVAQAEFESLPRIEVGPSSTAVTVRGGSHDDARRLLRAFEETFGPSRMWDPADLRAAMTDPASVPRDVLSDAEWRPRILLDADGRLRIRARNELEAADVVNAIRVNLRKRTFLRVRWGTWKIPAGANHLVAVPTRDRAVHRLVVKVVVGTLVLRGGMRLHDLATLRAFVLHGADSDGPTIEQLSHVASNTPWPGRQVVAIDRHARELAAHVILYGAVFRVGLAEVDSSVRVLPIYGTVAASGRERGVVAVGTDAARAVAEVADHVDSLGASSGGAAS